MGIVTVEKLENADKDADALEKFIEGEKTEFVKTRKNKQYPTLENAVYQVIETGGFEPFATEAELLASTPILEKKAAKALDTKKVWLWDGKWNDTGLSEKDLANQYTDEKISIESIESNDGRVNITDQEGFTVMSLDPNKVKVGETEITESDKALALTDEDGFLIDVIQQLNENPPTYDETTKSIDIAEIATSKVQMHRKRFKHPVARLKKGLNIIIVYGQSFAVADKAYTWITREPSQLGNLMLGSSPRGAFNFSGSFGVEYSQFSPIGGENVYHPLKECGQFGNDGQIWTKPSDTSTGRPSWGETVCSGIAETIKTLHNYEMGVSNDESVTIAISAIGANGANIDQLSKDNPDSNVYNRYLTCLSGHIEAAQKAGFTDVQVVGIFYLQGESNASNTYDVIKPKFKAMKANLVADAKAITGQKDDPAFFIHQIGGNHASPNTTNLGTAMAMLDLADEDKGIFQVGTHAGYDSDSTHMYANGYRHFGCRAGNIMYNVLSGHYQNTFRADKAVYDGEAIYISYLTPFKLKFEKVFNSDNELVFLQNYGFDVYHNGSSVEIESVSITEKNLVKIVPKAKLTGSLAVYVGGTNTNKRHNLQDSNHELSHFQWKYYGDLGQAEGENQSEFNDKNYALNQIAAIQYLRVERI